MMWVAEPCNRAWVETEVNAYETAKDKFWKAIGAEDYRDDPESHPVYLACGPGTGKVTVGDFREAVKYGTEGRHDNHGFMLHGDGKDWMGRACPDVPQGPAVLVVWEPK